MSDGGCIEEAVKEIDVFKRIIVSVTPDDSKVISWQLNSMFKPEGPYCTFYVEFAKGLGEWTRLNPDTPVENFCAYVDTVKRKCAYDNDMYYRVILFDGIQEYTSKPEIAMGTWNKHDWLIARDIIRKEYLRLKKYVGTQGWLLKKRKDGKPCECNDWDTGEPVVSNCDKCYGTGIQGGYYNAIPYWLETNDGPTAGDVTVPLGVVDNRSASGRGVAYPILSTYDVWIDGDMNKRYIIRKIDSATDFRGKPLIYNVIMNEAPASDIVYDVPLEQSLEDVFGPPPSEDCVIDPNISTGGWRQGISTQDFC
jgi:hypothetical protein